MAMPVNSVVSFNAFQAFPDEKRYFFEAMQEWISENPPIHTQSLEVIYEHLAPMTEDQGAQLEIRGCMSVPKLPERYARRVLELHVDLERHLFEAEQLSWFPQLKHLHLHNVRESRQLEFLRTAAFDSLIELTLENYQGRELHLPIFLKELHLDGAPLLRAILETPDKECVLEHATLHRCPELRYLPKQFPFFEHFFDFRIRHVYKHVQRLFGQKEVIDSRIYSCFSQICFEVFNDPAFLGSHVEKKEEGYFRGGHTKMALFINRTGAPFIVFSKQQQEPLLESGSFKKVRFGINPLTYEPIVSLNLKYKEQGRREVAFMQHFLKQRGIASFYTALEDANKFRLFMPFYRGDLHDCYFYGRSYDPPISTPILPEKIVADLLCGITALHEEGVFHYDIKPENILLQDRKEVWSASLSDFGTAQSRGEVEMLKGTTPSYLPVDKLILMYRFVVRNEQIIAEPCTDKVDSYALGIVMAMLYVKEGMERQTGNSRAFYEWYVQETEFANHLRIDPDYPEDRIRERHEQSLEALKRYLATYCTEPLIIEICFALVDPDPERRISVREAKERFFTAFPTYR